MRQMSTRSPRGLMPVTLFKSQWCRRVLILSMFVAVGLAGSYGLLRGRTAAGAPPEQGSSDEPMTQEANAVDTVTPRAGGLERICSQPGSVEPFEAADL